MRRGLIDDSEGVAGVRQRPRHAGSMIMKRTLRNVGGGGRPRSSESGQIASAGPDPDGFGNAGDGL
jgi:hypothetical protein